MQLDDDNLENDNNELSLDEDDGGAISWQDLLSDGDDAELSDAVDIESALEDSASGAKEFDLDALADSISVDDTIINDLPEASQADESILAEEPISKDLSLDELSLEESSPEELSLEEPLPSLEPDLDIETEQTEDLLSSLDSDIEIEPENIVAQEENTQENSSSDEVFVSEDEILVSDNNENINVENSDLSGIVDDELLSLLDESNDININSDSIQELNTDSDLDLDTDSKPAAISTFGSDGSVTNNDDVQDWLNSDNEAINIPEETSSEDLIQNTDDENQEEVETEDDTKEEKKVKRASKVPVLLGILLLSIIVVGGFYLWKDYSDKKFMEQYATASDEGGMILVEEGDMSDEVQAPVTQKRSAEKPKTQTEKTPSAKTDTDKKQKDELLDKVGANKKQTEETKTDKKVIVNVTTGGRSNPFVPSSMFNDKGYASIGASIPMPPDGVVDTPESAEARKLLSISVSGIMFDPSKPSAILKFDGKDYFVQKGDRIDTYTVNQITKEYVAIKNAANIYKAYVGESFQLEGAQIPPSQQMKYKGNVRQYISSDDIQISTK